MDIKELYGVKSQCLECDNYILGFTCLAFTKQIPDNILFNNIKHDKPLKEQGNDIVFEQKN